MGGIGSGGRRAGSGQKGKRGIVLAHPRAAAAPIETFDPPPMLRGKARGVWCALAPLAFEARTLTRATEIAFIILCRNVVLEQKLASTAKTAGRSNHRGMIQRVDAELAKFCLAPFGKALSAAVAEPVKSKWAGLL